MHDDTAAPESSLPSIVDAMIASYRADKRGHHINRGYLPSRDKIIEIIRALVQLFYPGYFGRRDLAEDNLAFHVGALVSTVRDELRRQIELCLCHTHELEGVRDVEPGACAREACVLTEEFLRRLPAIRTALVNDVQAAYDGDPAATNLDEVILSYPGLLAVTVYRIAHELHRLGIALMPRIMTEWAHGQTGADIHPSAEIGPSFFIDHATGVVIGETTHIGAHAKLYQGVTLGAISLPRDAAGRVIRGAKRHPTVEDNVTIYANATVLGGETVVGKGSVVGGSTFVTRSIPERSLVALKPPELYVRPTSAGARATQAEQASVAPSNGNGAESAMSSLPEWWAHDL